MNLNEEVELLKGVPIFSKVEQARLKLLAFTSERVNFGVGQEVCRQGDPGDTMYVILGGTADVVRSKYRNDRQISHLDGVGERFVRFPVQFPGRPTPPSLRVGAGGRLWLGRAS